MVRAGRGFAPARLSFPSQEHRRPSHRGPLGRGTLDRRDSRRAHVIV